MGGGPALLGPVAGHSESEKDSSGCGHFSISDMEKANKFCVMCGEPLRKGEVLVCILHAGQVPEYSSL